MVPWCSGPTCVPVKDEIASSNLVGTAGKGGIRGGGEVFSGFVRLLGMPTESVRAPRASMTSKVDNGRYAVQATLASESDK
jgi:hypothetical protein